MKRRRADARAQVTAAEGRITVTGPLVFATAPEVLAASRQHFADGPVSVDLSGVSDADSAGLAVLLEWMRWGRESGRRVAFENIPAKLGAIAKLSDVEEVLGR